MKVKVLKYFADKKEKVMRKPNDIIEVTASRLKEIQAAGSLVEVIQSAESAETAENSEQKTKTEKKTTENAE